MKILLPVDGSEYTKRMLAYLAAHDEFLAGDHERVVVTIVPPIPPHAARFLEKSILDDHYREQAEKVLAPVRTFAEQNGWKIRTAWAHGPAAETITDFAAKEKPGLIVMGTHGHSALGNVLLGSVATGVIARAKAPVLLIP
jgi:nucleotide-binding universal stress UspA family protein